MEGELKDNTASSFIITNSDSQISLGDWKNFDIDFAKVKSLEDVINILRGLRITISLDTTRPNPDFAPLMPYLIPKQ